MEGQKTEQTRIRVTTRFLRKDCFNPTLPARQKASRRQWLTCGRQKPNFQRSRLKTVGRKAPSNQQGASAPNIFKEVNHGILYEL